MKTVLKKILKITLSSTAAVGLAMSAAAAGAADEYPNQPIHVIVPYATGGADTYVRAMQPMLEKSGINLVIESVVGAGGTIGANKVRRSPADGYTLLFCGSGALTIAPKLQGDGLSAADFTPILNLVTIPYVLAVGKGSPLRNTREFMDFIKRNPDKLNYGTPGLGSAPHLAMEAIAAGAGTMVTHVPFSGIATALQSMLGGHLDAVVGAPANLFPQVRAGQLVALGVTSKERFSLAPEVPTLTESGAGEVDVSTNFGFHAPKGTPRAVIERLASAISEAARNPAYLTTMEGMQTRVNVMQADAFTKALVAESAYFDPVIAKLAKKK